VLKQGKECGRPIIDLNNRSSTILVLNNKEIGVRAEEVYGAVELPFIFQIMVV
jgi:hypothetical protein